MGEEQSAGIKPKEQAIHLVIKAQDGTEIQFKVKRSTKFGKMMASYAANKSLDQSSLRFVFEGRRLGIEETPAEVGMEDEDVIDANIEQIGGCR